MIDFDTELCPGLDERSTTVDEVVANVGAGSGRGAVVRNPDTASGTDHSLGKTREAVLRNNVSRKRVSDEPRTARIRPSRSRIVDGQFVSTVIHPIAEVTAVHFWSGNAEDVAGGAHAVPEPF